MCTLDSSLGFLTKSRKHQPPSFTILKRLAANYNCSVVCWEMTGDAIASIMRDVQRVQRGRSMGVRDGPEEK
jgi:hypothetical protein